MVDCTFYKNTIKSNCILLLCHVHVRSSRQEVFFKKVFLEVSQRSATLLEKGTLVQLFPCEFCKISKNTFSYRTPPVAASGVSE